MAMAPKKQAKIRERMVPGLERTPDTRPFFIPKITSLEDKATSKSRFVSPVFGRAVKDEVVVPHTERPHKPDMDRLYDPFRNKKKLTKEEAAKRYGDPYYEFTKVSNAHTARMVNGELDSEDLKHREEVPEAKPETPPLKTKAEPVSIDEFFQAVTAKEPDFADTLEDMTRKLSEPRADLDLDRIAVIHEEDEDESNRILFGDNEIKQQPSSPRMVVDEDTARIVAVPEPKAFISRDSEYGDYHLPPVALMKKSPVKSHDSEEWIQSNIDIINQTLLAFDIGGEVSTYTKGPTVTRYEIALSAGVQTKKITSIADNIQMNLAAHTIRIEAPIPGKTTVGIEVPNKERESVFFGDVVDNPKFLMSPDPLLLAIGLDIDANPVYTSIEAMPHGLVAGSTQSGKSVAIASIIASILYKNKPDQVKLLLIDPKKVDLQQFSEIPHLVTPIIDETKIAVEALKWAVSEMERRYDVLKKFKSVNVKDYYERRRHDRDFEAMPRLVVIVEEASDLLINGGPEVEETILKLTQKSRAVGIHLILATQRPSADIIKGSIKANIPTRFAFKVPTLVDSQVVLDQPGAEKLLGRGDMLLSENGMIRRLQGAYLSPQEIEALVDFIKKQAYPSYLFTHESLYKASKESESAAELDELFAEIARFVVAEEKCSLNKITQVYGIGFNRATQVVSSLELYGIVSRNVGTKPREVMVSLTELSAILEKLGVSPQ
jgi:S-DNA-T family DNA segregation ATPase FtsK/SpoIIIE